MGRSDAMHDIDDLSEIIPRLYVGSLRATLNLVALENNKVNRVLTVADRLKVNLPDSIIHMQIEISDHPSANILEILPQAFEFLDEILLDPSSDSAVVVHCASGISRSVSVCCGWLMTRKNMALIPSLNLIRNNRKLASPNLGFKAQLLLLEESSGDILKAQDMYHQRYLNKNITTMIMEQRGEANQMHESVDRIENEYQQKMQPDDLDRVKWIEELLLLQSKLDTYSLDNFIVEDNPAKLIRKSAAQKIQRLLNQLTP